MHCLSPSHWGRQLDRHSHQQLSISAVLSALTDSHMIHWNSIPALHRFTLTPCHVVSIANSSSVCRWVGPAPNRINVWANGDISPHILSPGNKWTTALRSSYSNPAENPWHRLYRRLGCTPESVWMPSRAENSLASSGRQTAVFRLCSQHRGECADCHRWFFTRETQTDI
jgi:hypothetical protein